MTSRICLTRTVISTVLPLPFDPTRPIIGFLEPTKSIGSAVWHLGQARRLAMPPHFGQGAEEPFPWMTAGRRPGSGRTGRNVATGFPVSFFRSGSGARSQGLFPRPEHWYARREESILWKQNGHAVIVATTSP